MRVYLEFNCVNCCQQTRTHPAEVFGPCFFPVVHNSYSLALEELKLHTLRIRRRRHDALFLIQVYFGFKFCPSVLETEGLRVPARYIRDGLFNVCSSRKIVPLLDVHQLLMLFAQMLTCSEPRTFSLILSHDSL
jgi:hypothetical protein